MLMNTMTMNIMKEMMVVADSTVTMTIIVINIITMMMMTGGSYQKEVLGQASIWIFIAKEVYITRMCFFNYIRQKRELNDA